MILSGPFAPFKEAIIKRCAETTWNTTIARGFNGLTMEHVEGWNHLTTPAQNTFIAYVGDVVDDPTRWMRSDPLAQAQALRVLRETRKLLGAIHEALRTAQPDIYDFDLPESDDPDQPATSDSDRAWARGLMTDSTVP